jgi:hypothetical protein
MSLIMRLFWAFYFRILPESPFREASSLSSMLDTLGTRGHSISVITAIKRTLRGNKEVAKCVVATSAAQVTWSIGASFPVRKQSLLDLVTSQEKRSIFKVNRRPTQPTRARSASKNVRNRLKSVAQARLHPSRLKLGIIAASALAPLTTGCGNPEEGTVTVSPEARARLRGGPSPKLSENKGKSAAKPSIDVRDKLRRTSEK